MQPTRTSWQDRQCQQGRVFLSGLAPNGVYLASAVASACGALLPHLFTLTFALQGGLFSVALSLGLPPLDVIQHSDPVEPGLSSRSQSYQQSSSHLTLAQFCPSGVARSRVAVIAPINISLTCHHQNRPVYNQACLSLGLAIISF